MRRTATIAAVVIAALAGALAGTLSLGKASRPGVRVRLHHVLPADPTMAAQCTVEPDGIPPYCVQGDFQVALTIGGACGNDPYPNGGSTPAMTWQDTGNGEVSCLNVPPPPPPPTPAPNRVDVVTSRSAMCHQDGHQVLCVDAMQPCGRGRSWTDVSNPTADYSSYRCLPGRGF